MLSKHRSYSPHHDGGRAKTTRQGNGCGGAVVTRLSVTPSTSTSSLHNSGNIEGPVNLLCYKSKVRHKIRPHRPNDYSIQRQVTRVSFSWEQHEPSNPLNSNYVSYCLSYSILWFSFKISLFSVCTSNKRRNCNWVDLPVHAVLKKNSL